MKYALVTTTIFIPKLLEKFCENFKNNGFENVELIVIGDKKTPFEVSSYCQELGEKFDYKVGYWGVDAQNKWLKNYPELDDYLPCFPLLKSRDKLKEQDRLWEKICNHLQWQFIPSI